MAGRRKRKVSKQPKDTDRLYQSVSLGTISARCLIWMVWLPPHCSHRLHLSIKLGIISQQWPPGGGAVAAAAKLSSTPPTSAPITSCRAFSEASSSCHSVCYKSCVSFLFAYTSWLLVLKCVEMEEVLLPTNLLLPHLPYSYSLTSSSIRRRKKRWRVSSCFWCFLVYSSTADELYSPIWHPSLCQVTLVAIWASVSCLDCLKMWWFFFRSFFIDLDWNARSCFNLWACRMAAC